MSGSKLSDPVSNPKSLSPTEPAQWEDAPLGMTVHTLPNPNEVVLVDEKRTRAGRWKMLAVLLVCASPVIASYFTYYVIRPEGRRNHGELIQPQRSFPAMEVSKLNGEKVALNSLKGQWLLIRCASELLNSKAATLFAIRYAAFTDTRVNDESQRIYTRVDDELLSFRTQGIGADRCALSF